MLATSTLSRQKTKSMEHGQEVFPARVFADTSSTTVGNPAVVRRKGRISSVLGYISLL